MITENVQVFWVDRHRMDSLGSAEHVNRACQPGCATVSFPNNRAASIPAPGHPRWGYDWLRAISPGPGALPGSVAGSWDVGGGWDEGGDTVGLGVGFGGVM